MSDLQFLHLHIIQALMIWGAGRVLTNIFKSLNICLKRKLQVEEKKNRKKFNLIR